ncbi:uncharacterized protein RBU47_005896 [Passerculus sandwichensis]
MSNFWCQRPLSALPGPQRHRRRRRVCPIPERRRHPEPGEELGMAELAAGGGGRGAGCGHKAAHPARSGAEASRRCALCREPLRVPRQEPQRPWRRSVCPGSEAPGQGIVRGTTRRQRSHSCHRPPEPPHGRHQQRPLTVSLSGCRQRRCKTVPAADLRKAMSAFLKSREQGAVRSTQRDADCELVESESRYIPGAEKEPQHPQEGPAAAVPHLPGAQEASCHKQGDATCERAVSADVENGFCTKNGSVREPLAPQGTAATNTEDKRNLRRFLAPQVPVTPATPLLVQGCPHDWIGYNGVCYYFSRDFSTWEQGQERCSELNASLAIAQDEEAMDLLSRLCGNGDFWLGLRRRGERLHWGDGSSYSSRVPVLGNSQCVYLADERFKSGNCSNEWPYVCSKAQAPL